MVELSPHIQEIHAIITGHVQGVGYRFYARNQAHKLGIKGWVKNLDNEDVEVLAQGSRDILEQFIRFLKKGPELSQIDNIDINWQNPSIIYDGFNIEY